MIRCLQNELHRRGLWCTLWVDILAEGEEKCNDGRNRAGSPACKANVLGLLEWQMFMKKCPVEIYGKNSNRDNRKGRLTRCWRASTYLKILETPTLVLMGGRTLLSLHRSPNTSKRVQQDKLITFIRAPGAIECTCLKLENQSWILHGWARVVAEGVFHFHLDLAKYRNVTRSGEPCLVAKYFSERPWRYNIVFSKQL